MSKSGFKEEQLEKLLRELPKISDNRDPKDIYHQIQLRLKWKKRNVWIVPGFASAALIFLFLIFVSDFSNFGSFSNLHQSRDSEELVQTENKDVDLRMADKQNEKMESAPQSGNEAMEKTVVYKEDLAGNELVVYEIPDHEGPYFLLYTENQNHPFFVQIEGTEDSPEAAFLEMRKDIPTHGLKASIPDDFPIEKVLADERKLIIFVKKGLVFPESKEMLYTLEAILLTAKDFGFDTVEIKNAASEKIGTFPMNQAIEVPVAPNRIDTP